MMQHFFLIKSHFILKSQEITKKDETQTKYDFIVQKLIEGMRDNIFFITFNETSYLWLLRILTAMLSCRLF